MGDRSSKFCYVELTILRELAGGHLSLLTGIGVRCNRSLVIRLGRTKLRLGYGWLAIRLLEANT